MKVDIPFGVSSFEFRVQPGDAAGFQQVKRADNVRVDEIIRAGNGTVHVRFSSEMQDVRGGMLFHNLKDSRLVAEIDFLKGIFRVVLDALQIDEVAGIRQAVQVDQDFDFGPVDEVMDHIRSDKAGAACEEQSHGFTLGEFRARSGEEFSQICTMASGSPASGIALAKRNRGAVSPRVPK